MHVSVCISMALAENVQSTKCMYMYVLYVHVRIVYLPGGGAVGSTLSSGAQGPGFEPCLFHDAHDVPVLCQLAV